MSDIELVARANRGDAPAFEEIYERYRRFVLRLAVRRLGNIDDAHDVLQETFARLFTRLPNLELAVRMTSFLYSMAERVCLERQYERRRVPLMTGASEGSAEAVSEIAAIPRLDLIARLEPEQRELLRLRFVEDLSLSQMADTLGMPVATLKSRLYRAVAALRDKLQTRRERVQTQTGQGRGRSAIGARGNDDE